MIQLPLCDLCASLMPFVVKKSPILHLLSSIPYLLHSCISESFILHFSFFILHYLPSHSSPLFRHFTISPFLFSSRNSPPRMGRGRGRGCQSQGVRYLKSRCLNSRGDGFISHLRSKIVDRYSIVLINPIPDTQNQL